MSDVSIVWQDGEGLTRRLAQIAKRFGALWSSKDMSLPPPIGCDEFLESERLDTRSVLLSLPIEFVHSDRLDGRTGKYADLQKIVVNKINDLSPLINEKQIVLCQTSSEDPTQIDYLILRQSTLDDLESKAGQLGLQSLFLCPQPSDGSVAFASPGSLHRRDSTAKIWLVALLGLMASMIFCFSMMSMRLERQLEETLTYERSLRLLATQKSEEFRRVSALQNLADYGVGTHSVSARLNAIQSLNSATPNDAWWDEVSYEVDAVTVSGFAKNAALVLQSFSDQFPDSQVSFAEPISDRGDGRQSFRIRIARQP